MEIFFHFYYWHHISLCFCFLIVIYDIHYLYWLCQLNYYNYAAPQNSKMNFYFIYVRCNLLSFSRFFLIMILIWLISNDSCSISCIHSHKTYRFLNASFHILFLTIPLDYIFSLAHSYISTQPYHFYLVSLK